MQKSQSVKCVFYTLLHITQILLVFQLPYQVYTAIEGLWRAHSFTPTVAETYLWNKTCRAFFYKMTLKLLRTQFSCEVKSKFHKRKRPLLCILDFSDNIRCAKSFCVSSAFHMRR